MKSTQVVKITYCDGDWPYYYAHSRFECRDATDRSAYDALMADPDQGVVQMGKVCAELHRISLPHYRAVALTDNAVIARWDGAGYAVVAMANWGRWPAATERGDLYATAGYSPTISNTRLYLVPGRGKILAEGGYADCGMAAAKAAAEAIEQEAQA